MNYYIVDAFTNNLFKGNPAGVCVLEKRLPLELMQKIATENNLPETAFVVKNEGNYELRWFTPKAEIDLCGHATLAAAYVISNFIDIDIQKICFFTQSGNLEVTRNGNLYEMIFPNRAPIEIELSLQQLNLVGCTPVAIYSSRDLILLLNSEQEVINYTPNYPELRKLTDWLGVIITAQGTDTDFVSRYFCPELDSEDPVTGSSHCSLIPYWAEKLGKDKMIASQLSHRGGIIQGELLSDNVVKISGEAALFMHGEIMDNF
ncbi:PhzF family phenazine biosynthesis protein [Clostridioides sp. ZZV15-6598]|uniref:PhzF family phenazine biosynthesis protein n=1 Tax=Clostridioides sp. ZZV15-6598 TaxID=2811501 RepID=UPI001D0FA2A9|nr:PhzF family phenazine biosynthesis protein [Clostridioides sp. ZZV15-6598]